MQTLPNESLDDLLPGGLKLIQAKDGYRSSIDPVLLSGFVADKNLGRVADLGTGSGIIPLLLAARGLASSVIGIERQVALADRARRNVVGNAFDSLIEIVEADIRSLPADMTGRFDTVVTNPPYRHPDSGRISPQDERAMARHELAGGLDDFLQTAALLLKHGGRFVIVYLAERLPELLGGMCSVNLQPKRLRLVHSRSGDAARLVLVEARKGGQPGLVALAPLIIYAGEGRDYSEEVLEMYRIDSDGN